MTKKEALEILDTIPTIHEQVDALELAIEALENQKTGHWIETDLDIYECSECHIGTSVGEKKNFCPNCGAKMEGE